MNFPDLYEALANKGPLWLQQRTIFATVTGSHGYGTATPESDIDVRGICIPPPQYTLGILKAYEHTTTTEPYDVTIYDLRKFVRLAIAGNPGALEMLYSSPECWLKPDVSTLLYDLSGPLTPWGALWFNKELFLSKEVARTFGGYAVQQLRRLHTGRAASNRGPARLDLIAQHGYDTKNGMHLVRVLRSGIELLRTGKLEVRRPDAEELLAIRNGAWSLETMEKYAEQQLEELNTAAQTSALPDQPDVARIDAMVCMLMRESLDPKWRAAIRTETR